MNAKTDNQKESKGSKKLAKTSESKVPEEELTLVLMEEFLEERSKPDRRASSEASPSGVERRKEDRRKEVRHASDLAESDSDTT